MEAGHFQEMIENLDKIVLEDNLAGKEIFLFGHCEATLALADELQKRGITPKAILDNSREKYGLRYQNVPVQAPDTILTEDAEETVVLIVTRFYEAMRAQLRGLGFGGKIRRLVDFNTYAEYSLTEETMLGKRERCGQGYKVLIDLEEKYPEAFFVFCPFPALGDVYLCMSYLPRFLERRRVRKAVICVPSKACGDVVELFGGEAEVLPQKELDAAIQAVFSLQYGNAFVAHQDRPYAINLHKALSIRKIPLEEIYRTGVFGLEPSTRPNDPERWKQYEGVEDIPERKSVILSPYAKSVTALPERIWTEIVTDLKQQGYKLFTNVVGEEKPLPETIPISPAISELKSVVERAGFFIGIRSGLCDVIRTADCHKIALYPDYNYCDTKWKAIDMYALKEFENMIVGEEFRWERN